MATRNSRPGPGAFTRFVLFLALAICLGLPDLAMAAESPFTPPPITLKQLDQYARRLNLGLAQWKATLDHYEAYRETFNEYKATTSEPYFENNRTSSTATSREVVHFYKGYFNHVSEFRQRLKQIDEAFFQQIESTLIEEQRPAMQSLRDHRTRQYMYIETDGYVRNAFRNKVPDLSKVIRGMKLTLHEWQLIGPILQAYERRLTRLTSDLTVLSIPKQADIYKSLLELGLGDESAHDEENWALAQAAYRASPKVRRARNLHASIHEMNQVTARSLADAFMGERHEEWIDQYMEYAYSHASSYRNFRRQFLRSLEKIEPESEEEADYLDGFVTETLRRVEVLRKANMAASDHYWDPAALSTESRDERWVKAIEVWNASGSNRTKLRAWIRTQLQAGLSDSLFAQWDATYQAITARQENQVTHASGRAVQMLVSAPVSLSIRDLNRIEERLDLDDEARAQFEILQDSYRQSCETSAILKAEATKYYEGPLQPSLIQRQLQRDRNFFGTLQGLLDDDSQVHQIEWMSKIRERQLRSRNVYVSGAGNIDPITFLLDADLSLEMLHDLTPMIDDFNREASERFRARHESCLRFFRERPEPNHGELSDDALSALNRDIARFHEKAMQAFAARLPEVFGDSLLDTFHRAAHVMVFQDPNALHHVFQRPSLEDDRISPEQHRLILDLRAAYISRYGELTETMVQLVTANDAWIYGKHSGRPMIVPLRNHGVIEEYAPLRYARDELNASTNLKIRTILTPTQVDSIGGLPDLE